MSPDIIILLLGLVALMALGIPICFAMMSVASVILLVFYGSGLLNVLNAAFVYQMQSESLLAIPMFALMAAFLQTSGIGGDIYEFFHKWLGGINGGLAIAGDDAFPAERWGAFGIVRPKSCKNSFYSPETMVL